MGVCTGKRTWKSQYIVNEKKLLLGWQAIFQEEKPDNLCLQRYSKAHTLADKISHNNIAEAQQKGSLCTPSLFIQPKKWHKTLMSFSHSRFFHSKNWGALLIRLSIERLGEQMEDMQWIIFASSKPSLFNATYTEEHASFEASHWAGKSEGSESIKLSTGIQKVMSTPLPAITAKYCWIQKAHFSLNWVRVTQVNSN